MLIENLELTMSHVGLGNLNEYALMVLFGNAHSHSLVKDREHAPDQIKNNTGETLYPAYFMTRLTVPLTSLLSSYKLWERISVGVDVRRFGETLLESRYALGRDGQLPVNPGDWDPDRFPMMEGNNLLVIDSEEEAGTRRKVGNPAAGMIAELPKVPRAPKGIMQSKHVRTNGFQEFNLQGRKFKSRKPLDYKVMAGRDAVPGHAMIFAKFAEVMDLAEYRFLSDELRPSFSHDALNCLSLLEREVYYFGNCYAGEILHIDVWGSVEAIDGDCLQEGCDYIPAATLNTVFEIRQQRNNTLLALAKTKKVFAIPMRSQDLISDINRIGLQAQKGETSWKM